MNKLNDIEDIRHYLDKYEITNKLSDLCKALVVLESLFKSEKQKLIERSK